jgi:hypothetical protein
MPRINSPFVPPTYDRDPHVRRMTDLVRWAAENNNQFARSSADASAQLGMNLANIASSTAGAIGQHYADAPKREAEALKLQQAKDATAKQTAIDDVKKLVPPGADGRPDFASIAKEIAAIDIDKALPYLQAADAETKAKLAAEGERAFKVGALLEQFEAETKKLDPRAKQDAWSMYRAQAIQGGLGTDADIPAEYNPRFVGQLRATLPKLMELHEKLNPKPKEPEPFTLSPGQTRFGPDGQPVANVPEPEKVPEPFTLSPGQTRYGPDGKVLAAAPRPPEKPEDPLAKRERELRVQKLEFDLQKAMDPAVEPDEKVAAMVPVFEEIKRLSDKIFTSDGVAANFVGAGRTAMASANWDEDVKLYNSLIQGMTPMVARAVGHTGVLTQQDVDSVKKLFGHIGMLGTDSKGVASSKLDAFARLMSGHGSEAEKAEIRRIMGWDKTPTTGGAANPFRK